MTNQLGSQQRNDPVTRLIRKLAKSKADLAAITHSIWWRFLWSSGLARPYSRLMCKWDLYRKYMDGRCQYCGERH